MDSTEFTYEDLASDVALPLITIDDVKKGKNHLKSSSKRIF